MKKKGSIVLVAGSVTVFSLVMGLICGVWQKVWLLACFVLIWLTETTVCVFLWSIVWFPILLLWIWLDRSKILPDVQKKVIVLTVVACLAGFVCAAYICLDSYDIVRDLRPAQTQATKPPPAVSPQHGETNGGGR